MHKCMWHYTSATSVGTLKTQGDIVGFIQNWFRFINLSDSYVKDNIGMGIRRIMFVNLEPIAVQYKVFHSIMIGMILLKRIDIQVNIVADNALVLKPRPWPVTILICCIQFNQYHNSS